MSLLKSIGIKLFVVLMAVLLLNCGNESPIETQAGNDTTIIGSEPLAKKSKKPKTKIIHGMVDADGNIVSGSGFTVNKIDNQRYRVAFNNPFIQRPTVTANGVALGTGFGFSEYLITEDYSTSSFIFVASAGHPQDASGNRHAGFTFIAIGLR